MGQALRQLSRSLWIPVVCALLAVFGVSVWLLLRELDQIREIYMRNRAAALAARLETLDTESLETDPLEILSLEDPYVVDVRIFPGESQEAGDRLLSDVLEGRALYRTAMAEVEGEAVYRAYIPFHSGGATHVARIDMAFAAADFLTAHSRRHVVIAVFMGSLLIALSIYAVWSSRRAGRLEQRQLQLQHLAHLGKMSAVLAHEIRNPLGTMKGFAQLASEGASPELKELLKPVIEESLRLENLVSELLLYGRPPDPSTEAVAWQPLVEELAAHVRHLAGGQELRFTVDGHGASLYTDPRLLRQVLLNLLRNAVEALAGQADAELRLLLDTARRGACIVVEDNGAGIPAEHRERVLEAFFTTRATGTGLGLPIAAKLTAALGGTVRIGDARPRGARIELDFPRMRVEDTSHREGAIWQASS